jgi:DNA-binding NarL/FixJ family response regulator
LTALTARQLEVLAGIASGRAHKQVAAEMGISYQTLCAHRKEVYRRLGIHSQTEAVLSYQRMQKTNFATEAQS